MASEASYNYNLNGQKFDKNAKTVSFDYSFGAWSLRSNSVTRQVYDKTKIGGNNHN